MSNFPPELVKVCVVESWLTTVTVCPGCTVRAAGLNAKLSMTICAAAVDEADPGGVDAVVGAGAAGEAGDVVGVGAADELEVVVGAELLVPVAEEQPAAASRRAAAGSPTRRRVRNMACPCLDMAAASVRRGIRERRCRALWLVSVATSRILLRFGGTAASRCVSRRSSSR